MKQETPIPSRETTSNAQINSLLSVVNCLNPYLLMAHREIGEPLPPDVDGGAMVSATVTFAKACAALDSILSDPARWSLAKQDELYDAMTAAQKQQQLFLAEQTAAAKEVRRPSYLLKPSICVVNKEFIAYWGNPEVEGGCLVGKGATPALAMHDFDAAFHRSSDEQIFTISQVADPIVPEKPAKKTRKKKHGK